MAIDGARIQRVTQEGLFYLDESGEEAFIDFAECCERRLAEFMRPENLKKFREANPGSTKEELDESIEGQKNWKIVGYCDTSMTPHYLTFYADPSIHFEFSTLAELLQVRAFMRRNGRWITRNFS